MMKTSLVASVLLAAGTIALNASPVVSGFNSTTLTTCDDCFSGAVDLGFSANFFGTTYTQTYVSNNGYVTFNSGQGTYTPTGLTASYSGQPIIAPFYADVDTRGTGTTTYGTGTYNGFAAFGVTYNAVGYYPAATDKTDTFQVLLVSRPDLGAGDFEIVYNYGSMQWETGGASGGTDGLGGISAAVGYANGTGAAGSYYQLPGSLTPGSFIDGGPDALNVGSNDGTPGQYIFLVENGTVVSSAPEPMSIALVGVGLAGLALVRRRARA